MAHYDEIPLQALRNFAQASGVEVSSDDEPTEEDYLDGVSADEYDRPWAHELEVTPCPVCRSRGACAYDSEGLPLIHSVPDTDDE